MEPNIARFLQYDYAAVNDLAKFCLGLSGASLAFLVAFADKVLEIAKAPRRIRKNLDLSFYTLIWVAAGCVIALACAQGALAALHLASVSANDAQRLTAAGYWLAFARFFLVCAGLGYIFGLFAALNGSVTWTYLRKDE